MNKQNPAIRGGIKKKSEFERWHYKEFGLWPNETMLYRGYNLRAAFNAGRRKKVSRSVKSKDSVPAIWPENQRKVNR